MDKAQRTSTAKNIIIGIMNTGIGDRELARTSQPMSQNDWTLLKTDIKSRFPKFRWPARYSWKTHGTGPLMGCKFTDLYFTKLLEDAFGGSWYFDDDCLVLEDKTIYRLGEKKNLTDILVEVAQFEIA